MPRYVLGLHCCVLAIGVADLPLVVRLQEGLEVPIAEAVVGFEHGKCNVC